MSLHFGGMILCGGKSERIGHPKHWLEIDDETLLARTARILAEVVTPIVVVASPDGDVPPDLPRDRILLVRDPSPNRGPLAGLIEGLAELEGRVDAAFVAACDLPRLRSNFVRGMLRLLDEFQIAVPYVDGFLHPLAAVYRVELLATARRLQQSDPFAGPRGLCQMARTRLVEADELAEFDPGLMSLTDVDTLDDWNRIQRNPPPFE